MRSSLCSTVWYTVCLIQVLCHEPFLCVVTSAPLDTGASRVDSAGRGRWLEPPASSRNRRQTTGGPLDDVLTGRTPANCTEEGEVYVAIHVDTHRQSHSETYPLLGRSICIYTCSLQQRVSCTCRYKCKPTGYVVGFFPE